MAPWFKRGTSATWRYGLMMVNGNTPDFISSARAHLGIKTSRANVAAGFQAEPVDCIARAQHGTIDFSKWKHACPERRRQWMESLNSEFTGTAQIAKELKLSRNPFQNDIEDYVYIYIYLYSLYMFTQQYITFFRLHSDWSSKAYQAPNRDDQNDILANTSKNCSKFWSSTWFANLQPDLANANWSKAYKIRPHRFGGEGVLIGGQNSNTKCSMTFVNIAVAISALAGGAQKRFRTGTRIRWCFRHFSRIFGCLSARGYWNGILGHFGSFPAMEKRSKLKKHCT